MMNCCNKSRKASWQITLNNAIVYLILTVLILSSSTIGNDPFVYDKPPNPVLVPASENHTSTIIFLHSLYETGHLWGYEFDKIVKPYMKVICPRIADLPGLYVNYLSSDDDPEIISNIVRKVHKFIEREIEDGIPSERIIVGGFSQGATLALHAGLMCPRKLAGIIILSPLMPLNQTYEDGYIKNITVNMDIPILQLHGTEDKHSTKEVADNNTAFLKNVSQNVVFKVYERDLHETSEAELKDVRTFVYKHLPDLRNVSKHHHNMSL